MTFRNMFAFYGLIPSEIFLYTIGMYCNEGRPVSFCHLHIVLTLETTPISSVRLQFSTVS